MRYLNRRFLYLVATSLAVIFAGYTLPTLGNMREKVTKEYFEHKEFLFNLKNASRERKRAADEKGIGEILEGLGLRTESLYRSESGLEVRLKNVSWILLPNLILRLEERYEVVSFSAVDNTGKGIFEVRIVLR